jgi:hypothetical protein
MAGPIPQETRTEYPDATAGAFDGDHGWGDCFEQHGRIGVRPGRATARQRRGDSRSGPPQAQGAQSGNQSNAHGILPRIQWRWLGQQRPCHSEARGSGLVFSGLSALLRHILPPRSASALQDLPKVAILTFGLLIGTGNAHAQGGPNLGPPPER